MEKDQLFLLRRKKQIKLRQIAEYIDCSVAMLSLYENDKCNLDKQKQSKYKQFIEQY